MEKEQSKQNDDQSKTDADAPEGAKLDFVKNVFIGPIASCVASFLEVKDLIAVAKTRKNIFDGVILNSSSADLIGKYSYPDGFLDGFVCHPSSLKLFVNSGAQINRFWCSNRGHFLGDHNEDSDEDDDDDEFRFPFFENDDDVRRAEGSIQNAIEHFVANGDPQHLVELVVGDRTPNSRREEQTHVFSTINLDTLQSCKQLERLYALNVRFTSPFNLPGFHNLKYLTISGCRHLSEVLHSISKLPVLTHVKFSDMDLKEHSKHVEKKVLFKDLRWISQRNVWCATNMWEDGINPFELSEDDEDDIWGFKNSKKHDFGSLTQCDSLVSLTFQTCRLPKNFGKWIKKDSPLASSLRELRIYGGFVENSHGVEVESEMKSLRGIESCVNLEVLKLRKCISLDITKLKNCAALTTLKLTDCPGAIGQEEVLRSCSRLQELDLYELSTLSCVRNCHQLQKLTVACPPDWTSFNGIQYCTNLKELNIQAHELLEISALSSCTRLQMLRLSCFKLQSLNGLEHCSNLEHLDLTYSRKVPQSDIRSFREAHPNCRVDEPKYR